MFEILYAGTEKELNEQIEERLADGWETRGETQLLKPDYDHSDVPQFVYFLRIVVKIE